MRNEDKREDRTTRERRTTSDGNSDERPGTLTIVQMTNEGRAGSIQTKKSNNELGVNYTWSRSNSQLDGALASSSCDDDECDMLQYILRLNLSFFTEI
jgi:hypothetical protein